VAESVTKFAHKEVTSQLRRGPENNEEKHISGEAYVRAVRFLFILLSCISRNAVVGVPSFMQMAVGWRVKKEERKRPLKCNEICR
jgi:hypothetical protein